jgi:hypothetical protein
MRVKFEKGKQRQFIKEVLVKVNSPSLNDLSVRLNISYSTFKKYYNELRLLPSELFENLCFISGIKTNSLRITFFGNNWGQVKGGKISKRG